MLRPATSLLWTWLVFCRLCTAIPADALELSSRDTYKDDQGSYDCLQEACDVTVCATDPDNAFAEATAGVLLQIGPDCTGWADGSPWLVTDGDPAACPVGRRLYRGWLMIWRGWNNNGKHSVTTFVPWENFKGATCTGKQDVVCIKGPKKIPDPNTGICMNWDL
ncbi:hypothetical protein CGRA01v4_00055 [Colletotrichum graminicola]|uniref:Secreted protein n=1 Tax=Colletotrichum graminicola (strain M1.001 / M2 / FGSC 10212) TaxID=645133 RepID=E3R000_COLGM|nr:uncharacterized protein GLRG_11583 [Colletotrichum graminicola M1.001]EFQ36438.1 hypothetical protein GLRG_11583 [Colletotrichum graminicola M1.001]WDK08777.1 hypothetical protein CGRA01v4_00055 [Colletotrichum graminicola]